MKASKTSDHRPAASDPRDWVQRYGDLLFGYAMRHVGRREVAEDLVQETLLSALHARESFKGQSGEQTWLVGILRNKIADHFRQLSRKDRSPSSGETAAGDSAREFDQRGHWAYQPARWPADPAQTLEDREFWATFDDCLSKLPPEMGEPFRYREFERMETDEICNVLNLTPSNLRVRLYRARMALRRCLEVHWFTDSEK